MTDSNLIAAPVWNFLGRPAGGRGPRGRGAGTGGRGTVEGVGGQGNGWGTAEGRPGGRGKRRGTAEGEEKEEVEVSQE